jgi:hypothetical protein
MKKYESMRSISNPDPAQSQHRIIKRIGDIRDWKVPCVCEVACNNWWMRRMVEDRARPVMIHLIKGHSVLVTPAHQKAIATWAILKSMVAEYDDGSHTTTHHMQRKFLMRKYSPPEGWGVWIGHYVRATWPGHWISHPLLILPDHVAAGRDDKRATYYNSHVSTQVIGQLFIHVLHSPLPNLATKWKFHMPDSGAISRIWPLTGYSIRWPLKAMTDRDADYAANAFHEMILSSQRRRFAAATARR